MSDTWNYACWTARDWGPTETRNAYGCVYELGPGAFLTPGSTTPFSDTITAIFSVLIRSGNWTSKDGATQGIGSVGLAGASDAAFRISTNDNQNPGGRVGINIVAKNAGGPATRLDVTLGDENGTDWMWDDKWYQVAVSISPTAISYALNGTNAPKKVENTNSPGSIDMDAGSERMWMIGPNAAFGASDPLTISVEWPSMIFGATAYHSGYIDLTNSTVLNRIFDTDGNFKNPGENGSLWFNDIYGAAIPDFYFADGSPIHQTGSDTQKWEGNDGGGSGSHSCPGGMRKQYETIYPDGSWLYPDIATAEASGDAWVDGDLVYINGGATFVYKSSLVVSGYSGLIHADPFNESGSISAVTVNSSEVPSDPDTWAYTDASSGTKGVDYELETTGSNGRLRSLLTATTLAPYITNDVLLALSDKETFSIFDDVQVTNHTTPGIFNSLRFYQFAINTAATDVIYTSLGIATGTSSTNFVLDDGGEVDTGIAFGTKQRLWFYVKDGRCCIWAGGDKAPSYTGTNVSTLAGTVRETNWIRNDLAANVAWDCEIGRQVVGSMAIP